MYIPLQLRLALFYTLVLAVALWFFGQTVYSQAEQRAYRDLDSTLSSRAASVQLGKMLTCYSADTTSPPCTLPSVDRFGAGGVAIEVMDNQMQLLATTAGDTNNPFYPTVTGLGSSPVPWDAAAARKALSQYQSGNAELSGSYSTITYAGQRVRVYTLINGCCSSPHIIQTARSEQDIQQSLGNLRNLLWSGSLLVLAFALFGGWLLTWGVLAAVQRLTKTARAISAAQDFSRRVPRKAWLGQDELTTLADTFNGMLASLEEIYQRQQRFVADASHELRAPLTSIRCNLDLLAKAPDLPPDEAQEALHDAQLEADRMGRLVNDLLLLARSDSLSLAHTDLSSNGYKKSEEAHQVDLDSLLLAVFRQYQHMGNGEDGLTGAKSQHMRNGDDGLTSEKARQNGPRLVLQHITPARVYGDADQLKQALVALLDNALKYTPCEGTVSLSLTIDEPSAIVKVSDTGIGILPADLPHIFERFYRADHSRSHDRGGSGLGLAIAQSIAQEHAGSLEVESTPGKGSTFTLKLHLADFDRRKGTLPQMK